MRNDLFDGRMIVTRTFSKSYSLAGIRFGFAVAPPDLITGMQKVKDSYNCDTVAIAAATAAMEDQDWMLQNRAHILATRERLAAALPAFGFLVHPSEANFLWTTHPTGQHKKSMSNSRPAGSLFATCDFQMHCQTVERSTVCESPSEPMPRSIEFLKSWAM